MSADSPAWAMLEVCTRVVVLGRGGAGKSTAARLLGRRLGVPVIELDDLFWSSDLTPTPAQQWARRQRELAAAPRWVMDGDLGPYDVLAPRLARADTVIVLDFGLGRCLWQAARRSRERLDFWWWVLTWRRHHRPALLAAISAHAPNADVDIVHSPAQLYRLLHQVRSWCLVERSLAGTLPADRLRGCGSPQLVHLATRRCEAAPFERAMDGAAAYVA